MRNPPADLPKFKRVHKALWDQMLRQKQITGFVAQAIRARATEHERECLRRVQIGSQASLKHLNDALQRLFETADPPAAPS